MTEGAALTWGKALLSLPSPAPAERGRAGEGALRSRELSEPGSALSDPPLPNPPPLRGRGSRWIDLRTRALSALVLGPVTLLAIWLGGWPFAALVAAGTAVLAWEWVHLRGLAVRRWPGLVIPAVLLLALAAVMLGATRVATGMLIAGYLIALAAAPAPGQAGAGRRWLAGGVPYIGIAAMALIALREAPGVGPGTVLFLVAVVWASDIGAYLCGRLVGGPKLAPRISPTKTVAGAVGGLLAALAAGFAVASAFDAAAPPASVLAAAALLGIAAQTGDLLESWIKRVCQVKDSSHLIPGHGGLLDRVDGLLAAAPVALLLALAAGPGAPIWRFIA